MKIRFDMTVDDYVAFNLYHCMNSPTVRRQRIRCRLAAIAGMIITVLAIQVLAQRPLSWPQASAVILVVGSLFLVFYERLYKSSIERMARRMITEGNSQGVIGEHELEISEEALIERTATNESRITWEGLADIVETDDFAFIYLSSVHGCVIPKERIAEGDFRAFMDRAIACWKVACGPPVSEEDAVAIARQHAEGNGWVWFAPVECDLQQQAANGVYVVRTNRPSRGCNVTVVVDATEGTVIKSHFSPR